MQRWTSQPLPIPVDPDAPFKRLDLEFEGVEHDGSSFVALVYLNNEKASARTGRDETKGFAAGFTVFGHGVCWGDDGHCEVRRDPVSAFDRRAEHRLTPQNVTLDVTDAVKALGPVEEVRVTVIAMSTGDPEARKDVLRFEALTLVTYE
jgi:tyrosinase